MEIRSQSHSKLPLAGHGRAWQSGGRHSGWWRLVSAVLPVIGRAGRSHGAASAVFLEWVEAAELATLCPFSPAVFTA